MLCSSKITEIYFIIDEFYKNFDKTISDHSLVADSSKKQRNRKFLLSQSEVMTILVLFHYGSFKNLKHFYIYYVQKHMQTEFPETVSYNPDVADVTQSDIRNLGSTQTLAQNCILCPQQ